MGRIRTIKPSFFKSLSNADLPVATRLTYIGLWTMVDDEGRSVDDARLVKADVWPLDDGYSVKKVAADLDRLADAGKIERYETEAGRFFRVVEWATHQTISHPTPSSYPPPPFPNGSGPPPERSREAPEDPGGERKGREGNGKETPPTPPTPEVGQALVLVSLSPAATTPAEDVFLAWCASTGKDPARTNFDPKRRKAVAAALKNYPLSDVLDAVRGWRNSPYHAGRNDGGTVYNDLGLLLRDASHIEQFRDLARSGPPLPGRYASLAAWANGAS